MQLQMPWFHSNRPFFFLLPLLFYLHHGQEYQNGGHNLLDSSAWCFCTCYEKGVNILGPLLILGMYLFTTPAVFF